LAAALHVRQISWNFQVNGNCPSILLPKLMFQVVTVISSQVCLAGIGSLMLTKRVHITTALCLPPGILIEA
jgi:hypothetical protein